MLNLVKHFAKNKYSLSQKPKVEHFPIILAFITC